MNNRLVLLTAAATAALLVNPAFADDAQAPAAPAVAAPAPAAPSFSIGMDGPIVINPTPYVVKSGVFGDITINGAVSGLAFAQSHHLTGDHSGVGDMTNAQILIEKTDGVFQFFVDAGSYSFPTVGVPYTKASTATKNNFGTVPMAYVKIVPNSSLSFQIGKLPTLIGAEYNFTFENSQIERGLLWNQENLVNRGVQVNYTAGPLALSLSVNDGFYSNNFSWVSGLATYTINSSNILTFAAGGNTKKTYVSNSATLPTPNNSQIYNLIYTHTDGPWTIMPYIQYTSVPSLPRLGGQTSASTTGAAVFVNYTFKPSAKFGAISLAGLSLPTRIEYITTSANASTGPNLLYGAKSNAFSVTFAPTYQWKIYYVRGEASYVQASKVAPGAAFGLDGSSKSQIRGLVEMGVLF
eukprot:gene17426-17617_t